MNILIVDDNKNNRMILSLLLEDYMDENSGVDFIMDEAVDGLEAVKMCNEQEYDLVFMDIMMPNMDGIEATKLIRQKYKKIMIIAVSAVDDVIKQKEILTNGAEDYISKPVNSDIFSRRVSNYINLLKSRETSSAKFPKNDKEVNLFTKEIFSRYIMFQLTSEDALSELWEYYLLDTQAKCASLSDVIRMIFSLAEVQIKLGISANLYVEDSENSKYFTVTNIDKVPPKIVELLIKKNEVACEHKINADKLSFKLAKAEEIEPEIVAPQPVAKAQVKELQVEDPVTQVNYASTELEVYDYIEDDDMSDLQEYCGRLSSLMLIVGSGDVTDDEVIEIYTYLEKIGSILSTYSEVYVISAALSGLALDMSDHVEEFIQNSEALGPMCAAFSNDLLNWMEQSFNTGAPSIDFMNDTIAVNCQTIGGMLKIDEASADEEFDDIFDF